MIGRKALSALLVAGGMMSVLVFGAGSANADGKAAVKELPVKDGKIELVSKMRYAASLEGKQPDSHNANVKFNVEKVTENAPELAVNPFNVMDGTAVKDEATQVIERTNKVELSLDKLSSVKSGCYEYKVFEGFVGRDGKALKDGYCGYQASKVVYRLRVYVSTAATGQHELHAVTAESQDGVKVDKLEFSSLCGKNGSFSVDSKVKGDFADGNKLFEYVIKAEKSPVVMDVDSKYGTSGIKVRVDGKDVVIPKLGEGFVVSSKLGRGSLSIIAPVGTKYCVYVKEHKDGYTPSCKELRGGGKSSEWRVGEDKEYAFTLSNPNDDISEMSTITCSSHIWDLVHTYNDNDIPVTGLSLDDRTGLMMAVVALGSIVALGAVMVVIRKKYTER